MCHDRQNDVFLPYAVIERPEQSKPVFKSGLFLLLTKSLDTSTVNFNESNTNSSLAVADSNSFFI